MKAKSADNQYSAEETAQRVKSAVQGASSGSPTPLKDIPKRNGESRKSAKSAQPTKRRKRK